MLISYNWLKEYLEGLPPAEEVAERLTMTGTEIESLRPAFPGVKGVITAEVVSADKHPNADRLKLCSVNTGDKTLSIVCGATNMKPGDKVALALPGSELPGGMKIKKSKIRGQVSEGMMCSEVELGLAEKAEGIMILPGDTPVGESIKDALGLEDTLMEAGITPNRADLLSIRGVARELGAVTEARFKDKAFKVKEKGGSVEKLVSVSIEEPEKCGRYAARVVQGVKVAESPSWIRRRLEAHGVRPINNVVDVTNYVLLELGAPMHAFDLDKIGGSAIKVRDSVKGEKITTLDGKTRTLPEGALVIADASRPVALAGVMGGAETEVTDETADILLECAWFEPTVVRASSKNFSLSTESSYRFERGTDIEAVEGALEMAASMILDLAGGKAAKGAIDLYPKGFKPPAVKFRVKKAGELLGEPLEQGQVTGILESLGIETEPPKKGVVTARPPSHRLDLTMEVDLLEEVARVVGYDKIPTTMPATPMSPGSRGALYSVRERVKEVLVDSGFLEVINYSFVSRELFALSGDGERPAVGITNPLAEDQSVMRDSLVPSLLDTLKRNLAMKNHQVRVFEVSTVFRPKKKKTDKLPAEASVVSGLMFGTRWGTSWNTPKEPLDFYDVKGVVERIADGIGVAGSVDVEPATDAALFHPGKCAGLIVDGRPAGLFGEVHPDVTSRLAVKGDVYAFELEMDPLVEAAGAPGEYIRLARFPESARDVAFIVDESAPYGEIIKTIRGIDTKLIERVELFDVYYGTGIPKGKKSLALRIVYRSSERTLKQSEVEKIHSKVTRELVRGFGAEIRGEQNQSV